MKNHNKLLLLFLTFTSQYQIARKVNTYGRDMNINSKWSVFKVPGKQNTSNSIKIKTYGVSITPEILRTFGPSAFMTELCVPTTPSYST
jgi:hypothetical protein